MQMTRHNISGEGNPIFELSFYALLQKPRAVEILFCILYIITILTMRRDVGQALHSLYPGATRVGALSSLVFWGFFFEEFVCVNQNKVIQQSFLVPSEN